MSSVLLEQDGLWEFFHLLKYAKTQLSNVVEPHKIILEREIKQTYILEKKVRIGQSNAEITIQICPKQIHSHIQTVASVLSRIISP